jgi:hypothetical protein
MFAAECLMAVSLPYTAFRFLPGLTPSLELFVTVEQLLRKHSDNGDLPAALNCSAVLLHAALAVWIPDSEGPGNNHSNSSGGGKSGGSDSGSSSSSSSAATITTSAAAATNGTGSSHPNTATTVNHGSAGGTLCGPGILLGLSSLAVSVASMLHAELCCLPPDFSRIPYSVQHLWSTVGPCSLMAADMLHLAAHQLQQPGADRLGAAALAAASQRLAAACAEAASRGLVLSAAASLQALQAGLLCLGQAMSSSQEAGGSAHSAPGAPTPPATATGEGVHASAATEAGSAAVAGDGCMVQAGTTASGLQQSARQLQRACRQRVQLVGCSNLRCANLSGLSAEGLVSGRKGVRCGGCRVARYCCPACQQADWPQHRRVCRRLGMTIEVDEFTGA